MARFGAAGLERRMRWVADAPLVLLAAIASATVVSFVWLAVRFPPVYDPLVACATPTATWAARATAAATLLPAGLAACGLLAAALALFHQYVVTRRVLGQLKLGRQPVPAVLQAQAAALGLADRVDYLDCDETFTFCYGFKQPRICVTRGVVERLDSAELAAVLRHEAHHARHGDPLKILMGRALASAVFFLPLASRLRDGYLAGKELTADMDAAGADRLPLARALIKLLESRPSWPSGVVAVSALSATEARVSWLLNPAPLRPVLPTRTDWLRSLAVLGALFLTSHTALAAGTTVALHAACEPEVARVEAANAGASQALAAEAVQSAGFEMTVAVVGDECTLLLRPCRQPLAGRWSTSSCRQGLLSDCGHPAPAVPPLP